MYPATPKTAPTDSQSPITDYRERSEHTMRDDQFTLRGGFAERLILPGPRASVYAFLADADTLLPLVAGVRRVVAQKNGAYRLVFETVGVGSLSFTLELELRVTGDGSRTVTMQTVPTTSPPLTPGGKLGEFTATLALSDEGNEGECRTAVRGDARLAVLDTVPRAFRLMPRGVLEATSGAAVNKQMETVGRDLMRNLAAAYPQWHAAHADG